MKLKKYIANIITSCRIVCSILMLFFPGFSVQWYILYLLCGFSDMIDGTVARKTNSDSEFLPVPSDEVIATFADIEEMIAADWVID